ncbi:flavin reductase family protein [Motiliproteus sp.]|uniref:flavin reductase family protein n=1 Tax=Motiliproteus sp. TaxID=1898955 RepID=UPI003BABEDA9
MCKVLTPSKETRALRGTFGKYPTGVAVAIAQNDEGELVGMTINSFTSASMVPPLVTWCIDRKAASYCTFANCQGFSLTVLSAKQADLAQRFATRGIDKFKDIKLDNSHSIPALAGGSAVMRCHHYRSMLMGDHLILVGLVMDHDQSDKQPLVFAEGQFQQLAS